MIEIIFLGTSASIPTKERGLPCIVVRRKGALLMFDCGEGAQRSFLQMGLGINKPMMIFISHLHGDHVLGIPGLLSTMNLLGREKELYIYGPKGLRDLLEGIFSVIQPEFNFKIYVNEVTDGIVFEGKEYVVKAKWGLHSIPNLMYSLEERSRPGRFYPERAIKLGVPKGPLWSKLQRGEKVKLDNGRIIYPEDVMGPPRPGIKITYSGDTAPCEDMIKLAKGSDLLIHEATYADKLRERALKEGHSTARLAAIIALRAEVKELVLTHISARYVGTSQILLKEASEVFPNTRIAYDSMKVILRYHN